MSRDRLDAMENEAKSWIEQVLEITLPEGKLQPILASGVVLCNLARKLEPDVCPPPSTSTKPFAQRENIGKYLAAATALGVRRRADGPPHEHMHAAQARPPHARPGAVRAWIGPACVPACDTCGCVRSPRTARGW